MKVKICGTTSADDAALALSSGADALGFLIGLNYSTDDEIRWQDARAIIAKLPPFVASVLVTHKESARWMIETCRAINCNTLQIHSSFRSEEVPELRAAIGAVKIIKAVQVCGNEAISEAREVARLFDAVLLDTAIEGRIGGTGQVHDWTISAKIVESVAAPVILAGGLTPENVAEAIQVVRPFAVDVNSGVELPDGTKSRQRIGAFIAQARSAFAKLSAWNHSPARAHSRQLLRQ